jgi:hypothetical protein
MSVKIHCGATPLDGRVAALLTRVGKAGPLDHMQGYRVERSAGGPVIVTVTLIADVEFDLPS